MKAIINPIITLNKTAPITRATPSSNPRMRAVKIIARIFIAGPEYKKAIAGPRPAPLLCIEEKSGRTVQEQTAKIVPETDATKYAFHFFAFAPKYFITDCWLINTAITPAIKNAGTRQSRTCSSAYHLASENASIIAFLNDSFSIGR